LCNAKHHPPSCRCGWGGEGHLGKSIKSVKKADREGIYVQENFCHPTKCRHCGALIFFVRYNGGSVWFDELGKPWIKHGCYYSDADFPMKEWEGWLKTHSEENSPLVEEPPQPSISDFRIKLERMIADDKAERASRPSNKWADICKAHHEKRRQQEERRKAAEAEKKAINEQPQKALDASEKANKVQSREKEKRVLSHETQIKNSELRCFVYTDEMREKRERKRARLAERAKRAGF
jgi:hypothetical protein